MKKSNVKDFLLYLIVGAIAIITEWIVFFVLDKVPFHYTLATVIAYILSTFVNWLAGRFGVQKQSANFFSDISIRT